MRHLLNKKLLVAASLLGVLSAQAQTLEVSGSTVVVKDTVQAAASAIKEATGVEVKTVAMGSGRGLVALIEGKTGLAAISESLEEATASARKVIAETGSKAAIPANLVFHEVGRDRVVVFMHRDNPVNALTRSQLKDIFTGKTRNWKELGGADLPVRVFLSSPGSGTRAVLQKVALDGDEFSPGATDFRTSLAAIIEVSKDKGGIAAAGPSLLDDAKTSNLKITAAPPIERPIALVSVGKPGESAQKVIDYLRRKK